MAKIIISLITPSQYHRRVNGTEMYRRREKSGLTQQQVADKVRDFTNRASLSRVFITQIERPGGHEIPVDIAEALLKTLPKPSL